MIASANEAMNASADCVKVFDEIWEMKCAGQC